MRTADDPGRPAPLSDAWRLRRRATRWEDALALLLGLLAAVGLVVGWLVGTATHDGLREHGAVQAAERLRVEATVTSTTRPFVDPGSGTQQVAVDWTGPDGAPRSGITQVVGSAETGQRVPMWTDRSGAPTTAPLDGWSAVVLAWVAGLAAVGTWSAGALLLGRLGHRLVGARIARAWEIAWAEVEPRWSGRRRIR